MRNLGRRIPGAGPVGARPSEAGSVSLELVLLVPVLVLLTLFVLWAGRGGRAGLTADLAAEEAAAAAALCCEEDDAGDLDREALVRDMLASRPGLEYLCVGGLRPDAPGDDPGDPEQFVREHWLEFEGGRLTGGVGVLGVQFLCESDGAVAPLRGLFPTVTFHGQASEVVLRQPQPPDIGFETSEVRVNETERTLEFKVTLRDPLPDDLDVEYEVTLLVGNPTLDGPPSLGTVATERIVAGSTEAVITVPLNEDENPGLYEGDERLQLTLTGLLDTATPPNSIPDTVAKLDLDRVTAVGVVEDDDPEPHLFVSPTNNPCQAPEGLPAPAPPTVVEFRVRLRDVTGRIVARSATPVEVTFRTAPTGTDPATPGTDYTELPSTPLTHSTTGPDSIRLRFDPGEYGGPVRVQILDDESSPVGEPTETFKVVLENPSGATLGQSPAEASCEILDDEAKASVADPIPVVEGNDVAFTVTLNPAPQADVVVGYAFHDSTRSPTATAGDDCTTDGVDYLLPAGASSLGDVSRLPITAGSTQAAVPAVTTCDDSVVEPAERFWLELSTVNNGGEVVIADPPDDGEWGTITDNDIPVITVANPPSEQEPPTGGGTLTFTVNLEVNSAPAVITDAITVSYVTVDGTAVQPGDYTETSGTLTFEPPGTCSDPSHTTKSDCEADSDPSVTWTPSGQGVAVQTVEVQLLADYLPEPTDETFGLRLTDGNTTDDLVLAPVTATGTIKDDPPPRLSVSGFRGPEETRQDFTVTLANPRSGETVTVGYEVQENSSPCISPSACEGVDYGAVAGMPLSGTIQFLPGETSKTVPVDLLADTIDELDETFRIVLSDPVTPSMNAHLDPAASSATGTITNVDPARLTVDDPSAREGETLEFRVTLTDAWTGQNVYVDYEVVNQSAEYCLDYREPSTSACDATKYGANDYPLKDTLTLSDTSTTATVDVQLLADYVPESDEKFRIVLSTPRADLGSVVLADSEGVGTIVDDPPPRLSVSDFIGPEESTQSFTVTLTNPRSGGNVTVDYEVEADTRCTTPPTPPTPVTWACEGDDYQAAAGPPATPLSGRLTFDPGETTKTVPVDLLADTIYELNETFRIVLSDPVTPSMNAHLDPAASSATGTITNVDPAEVTVDDPSAREGETLEFTVTLEGARPGQTVDVAYEVVNLSAKYCLDYREPSTSGDPCDATKYGTDDYPLKGSLTLRETPLSSRTATVSVEALSDTVLDDGETLQLVLSLVPPVTGSVGLAKSVGTGTIEDVDAARLTVNNPSKKEGETLEFTVTLEGARPGQTAYVDYVVENGSAKYCLDYEPTTGSCDPAKYGKTDYPLKGTLTLTNTSTTEANTTATVSVKTLNDAIAENDETLHLVLSYVQPGSGSVGLAKSIGVGTIENVNPATVRVNNAVAVVEGGFLEFVISLTDDARRSAEIVEDVTVHYWSEHTDPDVTGGTASDCLAGSGPDYVSQARTPVTFARNTVSNPNPARKHTVTVRTCTDVVDEDDETMRLRLELAEGTANAGLGDPIGVGTIVDAPPPALRIDDTHTGEGGQLVFLVLLGTRDAAGDWVPTAATQAVTVKAATEDGTARAADGDYTAKSTDPLFPLEIDVGESFTTFFVDTHIDDVADEPETLRVVLSGAVNAPIDRAVAIGTIHPRCVDHTDPDTEPPTIILHDFSGEEGHSVSFGISLSRPMCRDFWMDFQMQSDTAICTNRYPTVGADLWCASGLNYHRRSYSSRRPFSFVGTYPWDDTLDEDDERIRFCAGWGSKMPQRYRGVLPTCGYFTIIDNDDMPVLQVADAAADEGGTMTFTVSLDPASGRTVTVDYSTVDGSGTAAQGTDYTAVSGTLIFTEGETSKTFKVVTGTDTDTEDETFLVELSAPQSSNPNIPAPPMNAHIVDGTAVGTILEGGLPELRIADARGNEGSGMEFTVTLSEAATHEVTVHYATVERPQGLRAATEGDDYTAVDSAAAVPPTPLTFAVNKMSKTISVPIADDTDHEVDETFLVELSNPSGASLADPSAVGTINGSVTCVADPGAETPGLTVDSPTVNEDDGVMVFTATLNKPYCDAAGIGWRVHSESVAAIGTDFSRGRQSRFLPLETAAMFDLRIIDDDVAEGTETVALEVTIYPHPYNHPGPATPRSNATGRIIDDDTASLSVGASSVDEGVVVNFVVRLDRAAAFDVTADYATADGTATAGADYVAASGTATIPAGKLSATVTVATVQDTIGEDDETFELRLSNPTDGVTLPDDEATAVVTIRDDDLPGVRISDAAVANEGGTLTFTVTLDTPRAAATEVGYSTRDGTATAGDDYTAVDSAAAVPPAPLVFNAGETTKTISVTALTDSEVEADERFFVDLATSSSYRLDDGVGVGTIRDINDRTLTVSDTTTTEGGSLSFEVGFNDPPGGRDITVQYRTVAGTATAGDDYDGTFESATGTVTILAGETSATARVATVQDSLDEDAEHLELVLSNPVGATLAVDRGARGVIVDDDPEPAVSVSNAEATEGDPGDDTRITFTLSLSEPSGRDVTVPYSTADTTGADAATAGSDYVAAASNAAATIRAGDTTATVDVTLINDDVEEEVERFLLSLSDPTNAGRDDSIGVGIIYDDDGLVQILADDAPEVHEDDGASAVFTVRLSEAAAADVTVKYSTEDGNATAGEDYTAVTSPLPTLTIAAGVQSETVSVALVNDDIEESTETFWLKLSDPSTNARIGDDTAVATIIDDDSLPELSVGDDTAAEGATASFTVSLSKSSPRDVTVDYATVADPTAGDAAAVPAQDFDAVSGTLTIAARSTSATVTVALPDDSLDEHDETFWLRLSNPTGATIVDGTGVGAITDDDPLPRLSIADGSAVEGGTPTADGSIEGAAAVFEVRLEPVSGRTVTVPWTTAATISGNPATSGADYTAASGTLTFAPGTTSASIEVTTLEDTTSETDETFQVSLGQPAHATLGDAIAVGTIHDDDGLPRVFVADTEVSEDAGPATFNVTLSHTSSQPVTVGYATSDDSPADGAATAGEDYATSAGAQGTLTIPAGLTEGEVSVSVTDDDAAEGNETFHITLSNPTNAVIAEGGGTATATILDDEGTPRLSVSNTEECEDGASQARCQVRLCRARGFYYHYPDPEDWPVFFAEYERCWNEVLADPDACQEGMCGGDGVLEFAVELSHASTEETSVRYTTFAASAASTSDYVAAAGTLTIPAGDTTASIPVPLVDDAIYELQTETFLLVLDNPSGVELETEQATGTIRDDDRAPFLSGVPIGTVSNENDGFAYHRITLEYPIDLEASANYRFNEWSRSRNSRGEDVPVIDNTKDGMPCTYRSTHCKITFAPGVVEQIIAVPLFDNMDTAYSIYFPRFASSIYQFELFNHVNAWSYFSSGRSIVWDNEHYPYVDSIAVLDTLESAGEAVFTITLNRVSDTEVIATYRTVAGTATAGTDYTGVTKATVRFPPGAITATVTVPIFNDDDTEDDESFTLEIINDPGNSNLKYLAHPLAQGRGDGQASVRIIDDDTLPAISVADVAANEDAGSITFWIALSRVSASDVTVDYATADVTATAGDDYTQTSGTLTIEAGALGASVTVPIIDDTDTEVNETFTLNLSNASGATLPASNPTGTIIEDANLPTITISDDVEAERRDPVIRSNIEFCFPRLTHTYWVDWRVEEVPSLGDEAATIGVDFLAPQTSGTVTATPSSGRSHQCVSFDTLPDDIPEHDERFRMVFSNPRGVVLGNTVAWGTIRDEDVPFVTVLNAQASEADAAVVFTLQLHAPGVVPASLDYTTRVRASEGDSAAGPGDDYTTTSGTLDIPVGTTTATISVPIIADTTDEEHETFLLEFTNPENLRLRDPVAVGTITDDDDGWTIDNPSVWENNDPDPNDPNDSPIMVFNVVRDHTSTAAVTLNYRIAAAGSAVGGTDCSIDRVDYITPSGSVTLQPTDTTATITITLCDDTEVEGRETLLIELTGVPGRKLTGVGTITSDD